MEFGERLREQRNTAGMNQAEVGSVVGVTAATISNWERGQTVPRHEDGETLGGLFPDLGDIPRCTSPWRRMSVGIRTDQHEGLRRIAEEHEMTIAAVIREAIDDIITKEGG
jgi:transcriptional regulator with XRE-family HTH domain